MKKKPVIIVSVITFMATTLAVMFMTTSPEERADILTSFNRTTETRTLGVSVTQTQQAVEQAKQEYPEVDSLLAGIQGNPKEPEDSDAYIPGTSNVTYPESEDWYQHCVYVHNRWSDYSYTYSDPSDPYYTDCVYNGTSYRVRPDCSGYVLFCLQLKGYYSLGANIYSGSYKTPPAGFTLYEKESFPNGYADCIPGDILFYSGHVEIFAGCIDGQAVKHLVLNAGSTSAIAARDVSSSTRPFNTITGVWRIDQ